MFANQPWFRGVCLTYGPDGAVYVSDWCDFGECHDHDGIHRSSGRIYRISYGDPQPVPKDFDLAKKRPEDLVKLLEHKNHWYRRTARRELWNLIQRWGDDNLKGELFDAVYLLVSNSHEVSRPQRNLESNLTLATLGFEHEAVDNLGGTTEHADAWKIQLVTELPEDEIREFEPELIKMATFPDSRNEHPSPLVRLYLASACQKLPEDIALQVLQRLATTKDNPKTGEQQIDPDDHNLPLMIWYALEPLVTKHPDVSLEIVAQTNLPQLQRFVSRRLTSELSATPQPVEQLVGVLDQAEISRREQILLGMSEALRGWRKATPPSNWSEVAVKLSKSDNENIRKLSQELSLVFGDGRAMDELRQVATNKEADAPTRRRAIALLASAEADDLQPFLLKLLPDRDVTPAVLKELVRCEDPAAAKQIINRYGSFRAEWKPLAIQALTSRVAFADVLLDAIETGKIAADEISAAQAREIQNLGDADLNEKLSKVWGTLRQTPTEKKKLIARYKLLLTAPSPPDLDVEQGHKLFKETCANCHRLFGEGEQIAPDLTGSNRDNLDYLLMNILDPSGVVPQAFKVSVIVLDDGRVITGVIGRDDGETVDIQTAKEKVTIPKSDIDIVKPSDLSLMPDGLFEKLSKDEIRNLIGYLQSRRRPTP
jgi:putative heme-binding domain-containing protein